MRSAPAWYHSGTPPIRFGGRVETALVAVSVCLGGEVHPAAPYTHPMTTDVSDRRADPVHPTLDDLRDAAARYLGSAEIADLERAYDFADHAHAGHLRASGAPYIEHPLAAAISCADLELGLPVLQAALLHDVVEDCDVTTEQLARDYGDEVAALVDGVTKLGSLAFPTPAAGVRDDQVQAENLRRMFIAMANDTRVVIVKLADRLHNMRTLDALPPEKQQRIARETMEIYAPLAARLGIWQFKWQLEDLAFRYQQPDDYRRIAAQVAARRATRERYLSQLQRKLEAALQDNGVHANVGGRVKHIYSIHQKIQKYAAFGKSFSEIYDLLAVRVLVDRLDECYKVLGVVHSLWRPIPGEFDDYIGNPKPSGYQSLHTTVYWTATRPLEIQIRTRDMDAEAEFGVAAHWRYKQSGPGRAGTPGRLDPSDRRDAERLAWLRQLVDWQGDLPGAQEYVDTIKSDVFQDQVFAYTPKGRAEGHARRQHAPRPRLPHPHRAGLRLRGREGQRPPRRPHHAAEQRRRRRDRHQPQLARAQPRLAQPRPRLPQDQPRPHQGAAVVPQAAAHREPGPRPRGAREGAAPPAPQARRGRGRPARTERPAQPRRRAHRHRRRRDDRPRPCPAPRRPHRRPSRRRARRAAASHRPPGRRDRRPRLRLLARHDPLRRLLRPPPRRPHHRLRHAQPRRHRAPL